MNFVIVCTYQLQVVIFLHQLVHSMPFLSVLSKQVSVKRCWIILRVLVLYSNFIITRIQRTNSYSDASYPDCLFKSWFAWHSSYRFRKDSSLSSSSDSAIGPSWEGCNNCISELVIAYSSNCPYSYTRTHYTGVQSYDTSQCNSWIEIGSSFQSWFLIQCFSIRQLLVVSSIKILLWTVWSVHHSVSFPRYLQERLILQKLKFLLWMKVTNSLKMASLNK